MTSSSQSNSVELKLRAMEQVIQVDPGSRGIGFFTPPLGELFRSAKALYRLKGTSRELAIITGFPCNLDFDVKTETDGPVTLSNKLSIFSLMPLRFCTAWCSNNREGLHRGDCFWTDSPASSDCDRRLQGRCRSRCARCRPCRSTTFGGVFPPCLGLGPVGVTAL